VSGMVSRGQESDWQETAGLPAAVTAQQTGSRRRTVVTVAAVIVVAGAGAAGAWYAGAFGPHGSLASAGPPASATAVVSRRDIAATTPVAATLGYAGSYRVSGQGGGALTWLPSAGHVIRQGRVLYRVDNGSPVVLLYGSVPAWRALGGGVTGADVAQLNHDLVRLGYVQRADIAAAGWDYYSPETSYAVQQLEDHLGVSAPPGNLSLGQAVFEPGALRVAAVTGSLGGPASGPVLTATSDRQVVTIPLDVSQESQVKAGDRVTVTLPDGTTTPGVVSSVGAVATTSQSGGNAVTTIPVQVKLADPKAAGALDQAPVTVNITTATARGTLVVPVTALLARSSGGYEVEVAGPGDTRRYVPVRPGVFDDNSGLVQVTGALAPGQRVVVAAS
jgi:hypothetical protein